MAETEGTDGDAAEVGWRGFFTLAVLVITLTCLMRDVAGPDTLMLGALCTIVAVGVIPLERALEGFANGGLLSVMALFGVAAGVSETGALDYYMGRMLGTPSTAAGAQIRLMIPVAAVSAFINNTPVVAILIPIVQKWARSLAIDAKQLLIPLSFSSILGGTCTLIGTSTNLVVRGKFDARFGENHSISLFGLGKFGVPVAFTGIAYIITASPFLLAGGKRRKLRSGEQHSEGSKAVSGHDAPETQQDEGENDEGSQPLTLCAIVPGGSPLANRTIEAAGLRGLEGLYIVSVERGDMLARGVGPEFVLQEGDMLHFAGEVEKLTDVCSQKGLVPLTNEVEEMIDGAFAQSEACKDGDEIDAVSDDTALEQQQQQVYQQPAWPQQSGTAAQASQQGAIAAAAAAAAVTKSNHGASGCNKYSKLLSRLTYSEKGPDGQPLPLGKTKAQRMTRVKSVSDLIEDQETPEDLREALSTEARLIRARVKRGSALIGRNAKDIGFRGRYKAAIIAVRRNGRPVEGKLGQIVFQEGDVLLVQAGKDSPLLGDLNRPVPLANQQQTSQRDHSYRTSSDDAASSADTFDPQQGAVRYFHGSRATQHSLDSINERSTHSDASESDNMANHAVGEDLKVLQDSNKGASEEEQSFMTHMRVQPDSPIVGQTVERAGLRGLPGLFLASIQRESGEPLPAVSPDEVIEANDVLSFAGELHSVASLRRIPGVVPHTNQVNKLQERHQNRRLVQAVVSTHSTLNGKTVRQIGFRSKYDAVIIAVKRSGTRLNKRIGDIELMPGDVLLLDTGCTFLENHRNDPAFALVSELENSSPPRFNKLLPALFFVAAMISVTVGTSYSSHPVPLFVSAVLATGLMLLTGCVTQEQVRRSIKWDVYVTIASAFGISAALEDTGVAEMVATGLVTAAEKIDAAETGLFVAVYLATVLLSNVVVNNAAAALMFPIAANAALKQNVDVVRMSYLLMLGASAAFTTPFGYQTNLMVYGPGGYRFWNFVEFGAPLQVVQLIASVAVISASEWWWVTWLLAFAIFAIAYSSRYIANALLSSRLVQGVASLCTGRVIRRRDGQPVPPSDSHTGDHEQTKSSPSVPDV